VLFDPGSGRSLMADLGNTMADFAPGEAVATPGFYAPEQWATVAGGGAARPTKEADVYALGLTFACLDGSVAHPPLTFGVGHDAARRVVARAVEDLALRALVLSMTDPTPGRRPAIDEVVRELAARCARGAVPGGSATPSSSAAPPPLSTAVFERYRCRLTCDTTVAVHRSQPLERLQAQWDQRQRLVLLSGRHGFGKSVAAAQFCAARERADESLVAAMVNGSAVLPALRELLGLPVDDVTITAETVVGRMEAIHGLCVERHHAKRRLLLVVDDLDPATVSLLSCVSRSALVAMVLATVPSECMPRENVHACAVVDMPPFTVADAAALAAQTMCHRGEDPGGTGIDDAALAELLRRCSHEAFLVHRALERYAASTYTRLSDFVAGALGTTLTAGREASSLSTYSGTLASIYRMQVRAFECEFGSTASGCTALENLLGACRALDVLEFDSAYLRLALADCATQGVDTARTDDRVVAWLARNVGLSYDRPSRLYTMHHLQVHGLPVVSALSWRHVRIVAAWDCAPATALRAAAAWCETLPAGEVETAAEPACAAFAVVARSCGTYSSEPTLAPVDCAIRLWKLVKGPVSMVALDSADAFLTACASVGRYAEAVQFGRAALAAVPAIDPRSVALRAALLNNVGYSLERMGRREEGVELKREALQMRKRLYRGVDHAELACSLANVGCSLEAMGQREEGAALQRAALDVRKRLYCGVDHAELAYSLDNVGCTLEEMGEREEGAALRREAREMRARLGLEAARVRGTP